jgi:hypothetical protein
MRCCTTLYSFFPVREVNATAPWGESVVPACPILTTKVLCWQQAAPFQPKELEGIIPRLAAVEIDALKTHAEELRIASRNEDG